MKTLIILSFLFTGNSPEFSSIRQLNEVRSEQPQEVLMIRVSDKLVDCDGLEGRTSCYQIQKGAAIGGTEWEMLPGNIENFRYEKGFQYDLSVEMTLVPNAENGQAKYTYKLVEILSKTEML